MKTAEEKLSAEGSEFLKDIVDLGDLLLRSEKDGQINFGYVKLREAEVQEMVSKARHCLEGQVKPKTFETIIPVKLVLYSPMFQVIQNKLNLENPIQFV